MDVAGDRWVREHNKMAESMVNATVDAKKVSIISLQDAGRNHKRLQRVLELMLSDLSNERGPLPGD